MVRTLFVLGKHTWQNFLYHNGTLQAAAISYYILFSFVPMLILLGGVLGFVVVDEDRRNDIEEQILDWLPLSRTEGRDAVESALNTLETARGPALVIGFAGTLWTASAAFSAIRRSLNQTWGIYERRPFIISKAIDFAQLFMLGLLFFASFVVTGILATVRASSPDWLGVFDDWLWQLLGALLAPLIILMALTLMYRYVPAARPGWREAVFAAIPAALAIWILSSGFGFYVTNFNNFDALYGALAGILLFLLFMNMAANILLIGAEVSRTLHQYFAGELQAVLNPTEPQPTLVQQAVRAVKGMFARQPE